MSEFGNAFERLISHELPHARLDEKRMAELIELQCTALALTISVKAGGDGKKAEALMQIADNYIVEAVTRLTPATSTILGTGKPR